jgi:hypothetical protein
MEWMMHWIFLLLRLLLNVPGPTDGLSMAARADGRVEQMPTGPGLWADWFSRMRKDIARGADWALGLRAGDQGRPPRNGRTGRSGRAG